MLRCIQVCFAICGLNGSGGTPDGGVFVQLLPQVWLGWLGHNVFASDTLQLKIIGPVGKRALHKEGTITSDFKECVCGYKVT